MNPSFVLKQTISLGARTLSMLCKQLVGFQSAASNEVEYISLEIACEQTSRQFLP